MSTISGRIDRLEELRVMTSSLLASTDLMGSTFTEGVEFMLILAKNGPTDHRVTEALNEFRLKREQASATDKGKYKFFRQAGYAFCEAFELMVEAAIDWQAVKREDVMEEMPIAGSLVDADETLEMRRDEINEESSSEIAVDTTNVLEDLMPAETLKEELEGASDNLFASDFDDDKKDLDNYLLPSQPGPIDVDDIKQEVEDPVEDEQMASSSDNYHRLIINQPQPTTMLTGFRNNRMAANMSQAHKTVSLIDKVISKEGVPTKDFIPSHSHRGQTIVLTRKRPISHAMQASTSTAAPSQKAHLINLLDRAVQDTTNFLNPVKKVVPVQPPARRVPAILSRGSNRNHPVSTPSSMPTNGASTSTDFMDELSFSATAMKEVKTEPTSPAKIFNYSSINDFYARRRSYPTAPSPDSAWNDSPHPVLQDVATKTQALMEELNKQVNEKMDANLSSLAAKTRAEIRKLGKEKAAKRREMDLLFKCKQCTMSFMSKNGLNSHIASIHRIKKRIVGCQICHQPFQTGNDLKQHYMTMHPERKVACAICRVQLPGTELKKHFEQVHPDRTNDMVFPDMLDAYEKPNKLIDTQIYQYTCYYCPSQFPSKSKLKEHIESHTEAYKQEHEAQIAPIAMPESTVKSEDPEDTKPDVPSFQFKTAPGGNGIPSTSIRRPLNVVNKCDECGEEFKDPFERAKHIITMHKESLNLKKTGKPHQCKLCERSFSCPSRLRDHEATHTGERPFQCQYCNAAFVTSSILKHHLRTDHTLEPHKCHMCKAKFFYVDELRKHITAAH